ncbi:MAG TPA: Lrp/AsnC family transcriptional regulator [Anaerolineae bacterium]|nr:Lrp/AsnC family transcriptional regulator [Anaerolineae bacterium]
MKHKIDAIDRAIVSLLSKDGRMSCAEIARSIDGVSERTVRNRIDRLLEQKIIRVSAIVNPKALGYNIVADIFIETEAGHVREVADVILGLDRVSYVGCSTGDRDLSIQVYAVSVEDLYNFVTETLHNIPGVRRTNTSIVPIVLKDVYDWEIPHEVYETE